MPPSAPPDGGWPAWLRAFGYFVISFCSLGVVYAQGLLFSAWLDVFGASRAATSSVGTVATAVMEGGGVVSGMLITKFGEQRCCFVGGLLASGGLLLSSFASQLWHLHLSYGLCVGFGHSLSLFSGVVLMNRWFDKHKALASGVGNTGSGTGTLCFGLFVPSMIDGEMGWRGAMRVLALLTLGLCAVAVLLRHPTDADSSAGRHTATATEPEPEDVQEQGDEDMIGEQDEEDLVGAGQEVDKENKDEKDKKEKDKEEEEEEGTLISLSELLANRRLRRVMASVACFGFGVWIPMIFLVKVADDAGVFSEAEADSLVTWIGVGSVIIRIPSMLVADWLGCHRVATASLLIYACGNAVAAGFATSAQGSSGSGSAAGGEDPGGLALLRGLAALSGMCMGTLMSVTSPLVADAVPIRHMTQAVTLTYTCLCVGILLGGPIAGWLYDIAGTQSPSFIFAAASLAVGAVILNLPERGGAEEKEKEEKQDKEEERP